MSPINYFASHQGFFQLFAQGGAKRDCMGGGKYVFVCKACSKVGGVRGHAAPGNFDVEPFI